MSSIFGRMKKWLKKNAHKYYDDLGMIGGTLLGGPLGGAIGRTLGGSVGPERSKNLGGFISDAAQGYTFGKIVGKGGSGFKSALGRLKGAQGTATQAATASAGGPPAANPLDFGPDSVRTATSAASPVNAAAAVPRGRMGAFLADMSPAEKMMLGSQTVGAVGNAYGSYQEGRIADRQLDMQEQERREEEENEREIARLLGPYLEQLLKSMPASMPQAG
jgi:hypothetical protein